MIHRNLVESTFVRNEKNWNRYERTTKGMGISRGGDDATPVEPITPTQELSKRIIPIERSELPKFMSISFMMFLFIYVFTTVRDTKDALVVSNCGAEAIPFLKLYGVIPSAFLFILGYSKMSNLLGKRTLFYATLLPFFLFYAVFAFLLFPNRDALHFLGKVAGDSAANTSIVNLVRYWSFSLYFIVSELWASAGVPLLFWQFANDVTDLHQAKRFYPLFAVIGNIAPIVSGKVMSYIISIQRSNDDTGLGETLKKLAVIKLAIGLCIVVLYNTVYVMEGRKKKQLTDLETTVVNDVTSLADKGKSTIDTTQKSKKVKYPISLKKRKPTLRDSMRELSKSKELRSMAIMVVCYNTCIELTEVLWKGLLRKSLPTKAAYMNYMAKFSQRVGAISFVLQFFASSIIRRVGWKFAALTPPLAMTLLAVPFFVSVAVGVDICPLSISLAIGTWQNIISKVTKYSMFDPCKEMAYIPLGPEAKIKGKAAVEVMGARLGRSIGSASQQLLVLLLKGNILNCSPYLGLMYVSVVFYWTDAVRTLGKLFVRHSDMDVKQTVQKLENTILVGKVKVTTNLLN